MFACWEDEEEDDEPANYGDEWKNNDEIVCSMCGSDELTLLNVEEDGTEIYKCENCEFEENERTPNDAAA